MKLLLSVFLALPLLVSAQTAKVVILSPEDAAQAKALYEEKAAVEKKIADLQAQISHKYISRELIFPTAACITLERADGTFPDCTPPKPTAQQEKASHEWHILEGWNLGFEFSEDFKSIVPKQTPTTPPLSIACPWSYSSLCTSTGILGATGYCMVGNDDYGRIGTADPGNLINSVIVPNFETSH